MGGQLTIFLDGLRSQAHLVMKIKGNRHVRRGTLIINKIGFSSQQGRFLSSEVTQRYLSES